MHQTKQASSILPEDHVQKLERIAAVIDNYEANPCNLIMILHDSQVIYGYLSYEVQEFIAEKMEMPLSEISGIVTFYSFFSTEPKGKHTIRVCTGTACYLREGERNVDILKKQLNVDIDGTTEDGKFTLCQVNCLGTCGLAPAMMIDDTVYRNVNQDTIDTILSKY